jgi:hypothetical protein
VRTALYALIDPLTQEPFYIGAGKGRRIIQHFQQFCPKKGYAALQAYA